MKWFPLLTVLLLIIVTSLGAQPQGSALGFSIRVIFPSIKIEINRALIHGKIYAMPLLSPLVGYRMGEVSFYVEVKKELHSPDILSVSRLTER